MCVKQDKQLRKNVHNKLEVSEDVVITTHNSLSTITEVKRLLIWLQVFSIHWVNSSVSFSHLLGIDIELPN